MTYNDKCTPEELEMGEWNPGGGGGSESIAVVAVGIVLAVAVCVGCGLLYADQGGESGFAEKAMRRAESIPESDEHKMLQRYSCRTRGGDSTGKRGFEIEYKRKGTYRTTRYCCDLFGCTLD
jgi:hypothetical protein